MPTPSSPSERPSHGLYALRLAQILGYGVLTVATSFLLSRMIRLDDLSGIKSTIGVTSPSVIDELVHQADKDNNGSLDFQEFGTLLQRIQSESAYTAAPQKVRALLDDVSVDHLRNTLQYYQKKNPK